MSIRVNVGSLILQAFAAFVASIFILNSAALAQPADDGPKDQNINATAPGKLRLTKPSDIANFDYDANNSTQTMEVTTSSWDAFSNWSGGTTTVDFDIGPFLNDDNGTDIKRSAKIEITGTSGSSNTWDDASPTIDSAKTATPSSGEVTVSISASSLPASSNSGFGKQPLKGDIDVKVSFKHQASDLDEEGGDYFAPSGQYTTDVTGTISASN